MKLLSWFIHRLRQSPTRILERCLLLSLILHAAVLVIRFVPEQRLDRLLNLEHLEIILVNALSDSKVPNEIQALAQTNLQGGGELDNDMRSASPLTASLQNKMGEDGQDEVDRKLEKIKAQQQQLIARIRSELSQNPIPEPGLSADQAHQKRELTLKHLAEIEKRIEDQNSKPRTRFVGPSTKEVAFAEFYDQVRMRIESYGTAHFPTYNGYKLYGSLTMVITINSFGRIRDVQVAQSSGQPILDRKAVAIVHQSAPFEAFSPPLRRLVDQIALVARFTFTRDGELTGEVIAR